MAKTLYEIQATAHKIRESGKSIYDSLGPHDESLWLPNLQLEEMLNRSLQGMSLRGLPLRTRSKVVKEAVCKALGYPVPSSFKKTQPRFPGQNFDTYIQKANNLQVWNEDLDASRRYVLIRVSSDDVVQCVKVVDGATLAKLDRTGTLTQKYQARFSSGSQVAEMASSGDTALVQSVLGNQNLSESLSGSPVAPPSRANFLPIAELARRMTSMIGETFADAGHDQERNRGANLHRIVCQAIGYTDYRDDGAFPDITAQIVEVKLQTSPTIDLGLVTPDSSDELDLPAIDGKRLRHCDVRYAIFYGETDRTTVKLTQLVLVTGQDFFGRFTRFEGKVLNKKLQIPLPGDFFD